MQPGEGGYSVHIYISDHTLMDDLITFGSPPACLPACTGYPSGSEAERSFLTSWLGNGLVDPCHGFTKGLSSLRVKGFRLLPYD